MSKPKFVVFNVDSHRNTASYPGTALGLRKAMSVAGKTSEPLRYHGVGIRTGRGMAEIGSFPWYSARGGGERQHFVRGEAAWILDMFNVHTSPYVARGVYDSKGNLMRSGERRTSRRRR